MNHETFFENLELLADAPNGMQKLREMILLLAVQGKLVPQNLNDEPASELVKLIAKERQNAILTKIIRKPQSLPSLVEEELPFDAPSGWTFERFGNLFNFIDYRGKTPEKVESGIRLITAKNIRMGYRQDQPMEFVTEKTYNKWMTRGIPKMSDLLFTTEAPMGNVCLVDLDEKFALAQRTINLHPFGEMNSQYLMFAIMSPLIQGMISEKATGMTATGIKAAKLKLILIPLPPLNEQKRIVAKVDQLMALCDKLEARQQKKHDNRILLNNAAIDKLLTAPTPEEFTQHWQRICDNFNLLYDAPETVRQLRQAILQLAVQGKLVAQDQGDEPAAVLLEEINNEKERLVKDNKISKIKPLPPIKENEISYELPEKWMWTRLGEALIKITDGTHHSPPNGPKGEFKYITAKNIKSKGINLSNITYVSKTVHEEIYSRCNPEPGNILYIKDGATTGIVTINDLNEQFSMLSSVALLKNPSKIYNRYLLYVLRSPYFYSLMRDDMSGVAITRVTLTKLNRALIPLAPFEEQKRIVAKLDQLMTLCDELEAGLAQAQTEAGKLMEAVVHHVLAG